jgi:DNA primase small subunit
LNLLTRSFLRSKFREYYLEASLDAPPALESREWGFVLFDEVGMRRHKSFSNRSELVDYLRSMVPAHVYHSAAYYQRPGAPTMKEKLWSGADLIFDLDADHLRKVPKSYREMLDLVKKETQKLLSFLLADFGFFERDIGIAFSGGRGYHIHVRDPRAQVLGSDERREIVDYLTGRGLDMKRLSTRIVVTGDAGVESARVLRCPHGGAPGWCGRFNRAIVQFAEDIRALEAEEAVAKLRRIKGVGEARATDFYRCLRQDRTLEDIRLGNLDSFKGIQRIWDDVIEHYLVDQFVQMAGGETDEPVTADVRRLIRCPTSLHGGSGLRVTPLTMQALEDFDPLWDAVVFGEEAVPLEVVKPFRLEMRGETHDLQEGRTELPAFAAVFLMARGAAELGKALEG